MAGHLANGVTYILSVPLQHKEYLGAVRQWDNLKVGFDEETIWVKDFTPAQFDSLAVKSLPHKTLYYTQGAQLFLKGSLLPHCTIPSLLWTPIERGLPVRLPSFNHNYFGMKDKVAIRLRRIEEEKEAYALLARLKDLGRYMEAAPAVRLGGLNWAVIDEHDAMIFGSPLLPVQGEAFWRNGDFLFPAGYDLELPVLTETLQEIINPANDCWIVWNKEGTYWKVNKEQTTPLSIGSFRKTVKA